MAVKTVMTMDLTPFCDFDDDVMMLANTMMMMMITKMMMTTYPISSSTSLPRQQAGCAHLQVFNEDINP